MSYKLNHGKPKWTILDFKSLEEVVRVFEMGAEKYGVDAYKQEDLPKEDLLDSMQRHLVELIDEQDHDLESGLNHAAHIAANALMYLHKYSDYERYRSSI